MACSEGSERHSCDVPQMASCHDRHLHVRVKLSLSSLGPEDQPVRRRVRAVRLQAFRRLTQWYSHQRGGGSFEQCVLGYAVHLGDFTPILLSGMLCLIVFPNLNTARTSALYVCHTWMTQFPWQDSWDMQVGQTVKKVTSHSCRFTTSPLSCFHRRHSGTQKTDQWPTALKIL